MISSFWCLFWLDITLTHFTYYPNYCGNISLLAVCLKWETLNWTAIEEKCLFFFFPPFRLELCTAQILTYDQPENNEKACSDLNLVRELAIVSSFCWILWGFFFFLLSINANEDKIDMKARVKLSGFMIRVRIDPGFEYNFRILYCVYMYGYEKCKSVANIAHL